MSGKKQLARWMPVKALAKAAGVDQTTARKWLKEPGAPRANQRGLYPTHKCFEFFASLGRDDRKDSEAAAAKLKKAQIELAREEFRLKKEMGEFIEKKRVMPTLDLICENWVKRMRDRFELELPWKYKGKTAVEVQQMNIAAIDAIIAGFKEDALPLNVE